LAEQHHRPLSLLLRLTNDSQFGLRADEIEAIVRNRKEYPFLTIRGLQFFSGTQKASYKKIDRELRKIDQLLFSLQDQYGFEAEELEYGPGFPVAYFTDDKIEE
ncbi:MAG TPA: diaminopimelate decarboxylase, partial [Clostridiales bacterium]|nr:diaminopimelate decarboxylase [Clostridiales bacterium]